ncbi:MAG: hypothetical protein AB7U35_04925 [Sphingobium sp.]
MSGKKHNAVARLQELDTRSAEQRELLLGEMQLLRERAQPATLAREAGNRALDFGLDTMERLRSMTRRHPAKVLGFAAAAGAVLARRPLTKLFVKGFAAGRDRLTRWRGGEKAPEETSRTEE